MIFDRQQQRLLLEGKEYAPEDISRLVAEGAGNCPPALWDLYLFLNEWFDASPIITVHTSGSTGVPKELVVRKDRMMQSARLTCEFLNLQAGDTALLCMNLRYIGAMMMVVRSLVAGLNLVVRPASGHPLSDVEVPLKFAAMVPLQVYNTIRVPAERKRLEHTDILIIGGGAVDDSLEAELKTIPIAAYSTYGMTETLSHIALRRLNGEAASKCYYPFPSVELSLSAENTLIVKAPLICDDVLQTNDIACLCSDGGFTIAGRKDNVINSGGIKIQAEEMENRLQPFIPVPFAVTAVPDPCLGQALTLLIAGKPDIKELENKLQAVLETYYRPKHIFITELIPQTENGKIDRTGCRILAQQMNRLHPLMFAGTGSDVGKSIISAAFCRIFKQDGYRPAPFKAQNMALNSYATPEGLEIGRAQAVQAEAAGVPCHTDMNPLLLKPQSDCTSQVVLNGRPIGNRSAYGYFHKEGREELRREVCAAYDRLSKKYNPVVLEGAGSISEINLREVDLVNLPMAMYAGADVILVADIDRGGVFASVYGSVMLLTPEERKHVKGILINKFRGDIRLFESGVKMLEELCGIPVVGVVPYYKDIYIEEEDSLALATKSLQAEQGKVNIAVVLLRHLSNFTDFNVLERDPRVHLFYTNNTEELAKADIIILPGSKSTLADLYELRRNGVAQAVVRAHREGAAVLGICGGYQLMGQEVFDPDHVEGDIERLPGLGLLPVSTRMTGEKVTRQVKFQLFENGERATEDGTLKLSMSGYEIHMGSTVPIEGTSASPLNMLEDGLCDGYIVDSTCMGTYIHGILDNPEFIDFLLKPFAGKLSETAEAFNYQQFKEEQYDKLAEHVRQHVDMPLIYKILTDNI
ncbi:cobyric acid synthase [Bacteroides eggerthii]|uniref:Cobyric acid synthase n=2 Tax=Bacteroides eggerthii TaxID=28111 RepID=A0A380YMI0_9BACE|nr:cobyric acid synthase [Bacteroides eggerthii]EEC53004.1 cobyric acid synthase CobQ [Bacteroides eggerthii DSM 20697]QRQ47716.1 cobyric acid synthase [Bacteroides eggerthii]SUV29118.1 adenosylcobyric acid synthase (glutamine-hydrolysing) [Bacteroides eggerthii]